MRDRQTLAAICTWEARSWIGTPFAERQMLKGCGVSCHALVHAAGWRAEVLPHGQDEFDAKFGDHGRIPNGHRWREYLEAFFVEVDPAEPIAEADIAWLSWSSQDRFRFKNLRPWGTHLGLLTLDAEHGPNLIHASVEAGVEEVGFRGPWLPRLVGRWRFPGLA